jgi:hypothetical protein
MGGTRWSDDHYHQRAAKLRATGKSAFGHNDDIQHQRVAAQVHALMDPSKIKNGARESRDSEKNPSSNAIAVLFDVTGSMKTVPKILQKNLCKLFGLLVQHQYIPDPAILVGGIGDATCDTAPLQVGQFESGNEIEDDLSRLFLEGGGGGQKTESYELGLYFLARKTKIDCLEKRNRKGFAFIIGDESPYTRVKRREVEHLFGDSIGEDIDIDVIIKEVQAKYELFFVLPNLTSYYDDPQILNEWRKLLGQNVLRLEDPEAICELIASTIGLSNRSFAWDEIRDQLRGAGTTQQIAKAVSNSLAHVRPVDLQGTGLVTF